MKVTRLLAALGVLALVATVAWADYNVLDKTTYKQNATSGARTNAAGDARVEVTNPDENFVVYEPAWLSTRLTGRLSGGLPPTVGVFIQDSTAAVNVSGANGLALMLYPTFDDSVRSVALAIQFRWHYSSVVDSQSTFIEMGSRRFRMTSVATTGNSSPISGTVRDSIGSFLFQPLAASGLSQYSVGGAAVANVDSLATPDEEVLVLTNVSGVSRGRMIRITPPDGPSGSSSGPYLSVRVRYLNGYNGSGLAWSSAASLGVTYEPIMNLTIGLVGWR